MTLYRRIGILISLLLLLLLAAVLSVNFLNSKKYIEEQLERDAKNSALALSVSLGPIMDDKEEVKRLIEKLFNKGSFEIISIEDSNRMPIYRRTESSIDSGAPDWFKKFLPIHAPVVEVVISTDGKSIGVLKVKTDSEIAYDQLFSLFKYNILLFLIFAFIGLFLLRFVLRIVLRSLDSIKEQAEGVLHNHFIIQKELPSTEELKEIATVMNSMVKRVKEIYERNVESMKKNQEVLYKDSVTSLFNRRYFQVKMPEYLIANDSRSRGSVILVRVNKISEANRKIGHQKVDDFFAKFGEILKKSCENVHEPLICRINGTEIILVLPVFNAATAKELVRNIMKDALLLREEFSLGDCIYFSFGITKYKREESVAKLLASADYAVSDAALYNENHITVFEGDKKAAVVLGKNQWRELIETALKNEKLEPSLAPVINLKKNEKVAYSLTFDIRYGTYSYIYGDYLPAVVELGLEQDLVMYEFEYLKKHRFTHNALSLEIFAKTLYESDNYLRFEESVKEIVKTIRGRLFIELSEYDILTLDPVVVERISHTLKEIGIRFGVNRFSVESGGYGYLKYMAPAYVKMHKNLYIDMDIGSKNALLTLLRSLDIKLILTDVQEDNIEELKEDGIQYIVPRI